MLVYKLALTDYYRSTIKPLFSQILLESLLSNYPNGGTELQIKAPNCIFFNFVFTFLVFLIHLVVLKCPQGSASRLLCGYKMDCQPWLTLIYNVVYCIWTTAFGIFNISLLGLYFVLNLSVLWRSILRGQVQCSSRVSTQICAWAG